MAKTYNTPTSGTVVDKTAEREFLDALSAAVCLTPAEEEKFCPTMHPTASEIASNVPDRDPDEDDFGPDLDDLDGPSDEELVRSLLTS
jgi:hypothetical protein